MRAMTGKCVGCPLGLFACWNRVCSLTTVHSFRALSINGTSQLKPPTDQSDAMQRRSICKCALDSVLSASASSSRVPLAILVRLCLPYREGTTTLYYVTSRSGPPRADADLALPPRLPVLLGRYGLPRPRWCLADGARGGRLAF
ncbi:hypothetical protein B0T19DRAFT_148638 [Cercophora scortea]|uniref:Uncharacterized protein n=1 Tax=Cercophora scortea TaxID=314031 RepID=A0AAE0IZQ9_9PEZI|nr:hypothetical protein B0T19DRAFT_148638 [Cercophora scortea]